MSTPQVTLVPVDGSDNALRAVNHLITMIKAGHSTEVHLINAQPPVSGDVSSFVGRGAVDDYHKDEAHKALASAKQALDKAGLGYKEHIVVGNPGDVIASFAKKLHATQIVMGTRGLGSAFGLLLGSVATHVISHVDVPVTLVK